MRKRVPVYLRTRKNAVHADYAKLRAIPQLSKNRLGGLVFGRATGCSETPQLPVLDLSVVRDRESIARKTGIVRAIRRYRTVYR